jgi:formylglycine-generating enzyme required for sulfatase activity
MIRVPAGSYRPFFKSKDPGQRILVSAFLLDAAPVTRAEFAAFLAREPKWRTAKVKRLFAEAGYLAGWKNDEPPAGTAEDPVTHVSWFAAKSYCECEGKRLPTQLEWEWAAESPAPTADASAAAATRVASNESASSSPDPGVDLRFAMGQGRVPGLAFGRVWEWTSDFNSLLVAGATTDTGASLFCGDGFRANDARDYSGFLRFSFRSSLKASYTLKNLGFRCAKSLP